MITHPETIGCRKKTHGPSRRVVPIEPLLPVAARALDMHRDHRGHFEYGGDQAHQTVLGIRMNHWHQLTRRKYISVNRADDLATHLNRRPEEIWGDAWNTHYDPPTESQAA